MTNGLNYVRNYIKYQFLFLKIEHHDYLTS